MNKSKIRKFEIRNKSETTNQKHMNQMMHQVAIAILLIGVASCGLAQQCAPLPAEKATSAAAPKSQCVATDNTHPQVFLRARVIEISPTKMRNIGYDYERVFGSQMPGEELDKVLDALRKDGLVKILAAPNVVTTNNRAASAHVGGRTRVAVDKDDGKRTIENRFCGTQVDFTPTVSDDHIILLKICVELSHADRADQLTIDGETAPRLLTTLADTTVSCKSGKTVALAEFSSSSATDETAGVAPNGKPNPSAKKAGEFTEILFIAAAEVVAATPSKTAAVVPTHR